MSSTLKIDKVSFNHGSQVILDDLSLTIESGQLACLLGPSGCGKSTLLRLIAGFEQPRTGHIFINGNCVADSTNMTAPQYRRVGMLFQDLALFPHLTVAENIAFGLQQASSTQRRERANELLELCRLQPFQARYPHQISGGQCQRVALARAMAPRPNIILLDEPFSSIDSGLQNDLAHEVKSMLQADQSTALWVTHSLDEAFAVADQMGIMLVGRLLQWGNPEQLYEYPAHPEIIDFINQANLVKGQVTNEGTVATVIGTYNLRNAKDFGVNDPVQIGIGKKDIQINANGEIHNAIITKMIYQGNCYEMSAQLVDGSVLHFYHDHQVEITQPVNLHVVSNRSFQAFRF